MQCLNILELNAEISIAREAINRGSYFTVTTYLMPLSMQIHYVKILTSSYYIIHENKLRISYCSYHLKYEWL